MLSTLTSKGQVTIPKSIRDALHLKPNDKVDFIRDGETIILVPIRTLKEYRGAVKTKASVPIDQARAQAKTAVAERVIQEMK